MKSFDLQRSTCASVVRSLEPPYTSLLPWPVLHELSAMKKKSQLVKAEEDLKWATRFLKPTLAIVGAWPIPSTSSNLAKILHKTEHIVTYSLFFLMLAPSILYLFLKEKNGKAKLKLLAPIINSGIQFFKYTVLLCRMKEVRMGLEMIRHDWIHATEETRTIFLSKAKIARKIVMFAAITMYGGGLCYRIILPLLRGTIVTPDNVTIRPLPCATYFVILNEQATPNYEIIFTLQVLAGFVSYAIISGSCGICALLVLHTCSMMRILMGKIEELANKRDMSNAVVQQRIVDIVEYQEKINRFFKNIKKVTEYICLIEMLGGTSLICIAGYYILMEWENSNATAVVVIITLQISCIFNVFVLCYIGQLLDDETKNVGQTSCTLNWYRLPKKHARCLILIIAMSNYPMKLTAGKVLEISLATFTDVMKMSMGYLNMLREVL